jgi:hypothetical protein
VTVGGSAGGVGTSTVVLAVAGLSAWAGARTLAGVRGVGWGLRQVPVGALDAPDAWSRADDLAGLTTARAVELVGPDTPVDPVDPHLDVLVVDRGVDGDVDVLVCRPDRAGLTVLGTTTAAAVVVVGEGPVAVSELARAAGSRRTIQLPWSVRVARAGLTGRVPAGLPGTWLRRLAPLVPTTERRAGASEA